MFKTRKTKKGFTLVELLVVIAIIAILFVVLISKVDFAADKAKEAGAQTDLRSMYLSMEMVALEYAGYDPLIDKNQEGTITGYSKLASALNENLDRKLEVSIDENGKITMSNKTKDPWKEEYHGLYVTGTDGKDRGCIIMFSNGPDLKFGTTPQVVNGELIIEKSENGFDDIYIATVYNLSDGYGTVDVYTNAMEVKSSNDRDVITEVITPDLSLDSAPPEENLKIDLSSKNQVSLINGDSLKYNKESPTILTFRSPAEFSTFVAVLVDDEICDSSNYTATEGSTVVTFSEEYSALLSIGLHTVDIVSEAEYARGTVEVWIPDPMLNHKNTIPNGGIYTATNGIVYVEGDLFPTFVSAGDKYQYGDYTYTYETNTYEYFADAAGWNVKVSSSKWNDTYDRILETINNKPITGMASCFYECKSMTEAPVIPSTVTDLEYAFYKCESLINAPELPESAGSIQMAFYGCKSLIGAPAIPNKVTQMSYAFHGCSTLVVPPDMSNATSVKTMLQTFKDCKLLESTPDLSNCTSLTNMEKTFYGCSKLKTVTSPIGANVTNLGYTFKNCTSLTGTITFNCTKISTCTGVFENVKLKAQGITVNGSYSNKYSITSTASNRGND
jgi:prepilin-type N-terminal cleavage/methylation domain-containing protein